MKRTQHFVVTLSGFGLTRRMAHNIIRSGLRSWGYGLSGGNGTAKVKPIILRSKSPEIRKG